MLDRISRWLRLTQEPDKCAESAVRLQLEQQVSAQLVELIAYMDRLGIRHEPLSDQTPHRMPPSRELPN